MTEATEIVLISDMHLSRARPFFHFNWEVTLERLGEKPPALILVAGDIALDGSHHRDDLAFAKKQLDRLPCQWLAVPGNHDVGNNLPDLRGEAVITAERLKIYKDILGDDFWSHDVGGWRFIGLNSLLCGSGLAEEETQKRFLRSAIETRGSRRVATIYHKPFCHDAWGEAPIGQHFWFPETRHLLLSYLQAGQIDLQISGHLHESRLKTIEGVANIWVPSLSFATDMTFDWRPNLFNGRRRVGLTELRISGERWSARTIEPPELLNTDISGWMRGGNIDMYAKFAGEREFLGYAAGDGDRR
ncbi:metallophosphoesterase [Microvirga sp. VF16]|uniref:metallophosphoesterase family protein n=1 Tax=Microvirga sp. VF16 TaxID=2807101 RepID=UPI00193DCABA|nr:metallophosphoesterase [Microvirga sp. VF16]QRM32354.1 metallophosphoesterase [Microvirga sp. VF16]